MPQVIVAQSDFEVRADIVTPLRYVHNEGKLGSADETITFDWHAGEAESVTGPIELHDRVVDPASVNAALMLDMLLGRSIDSYSVLDEDGIQEYAVNVGTAEAFDHPLAAKGAIRVVHERSGSSRMPTTWVIPELRYVPAQIEQSSDNGTTRRARREVALGRGIVAASG